MAQLESVAPDLQTSHAIASMRGVKDDMVAIFGPDQRVGEGPLLNRAQLVRSMRRRRMIVVALTACGVATMLTVGVVGGRSVSNVTRTGESESGGLYKVAKFPLSAPRAAVAAGSFAQPARVDASTFPTVPVGSDPLVPSVPSVASITSVASTPNVSGPSSAIATNRRSSHVPVDRTDLIESARVSADVDRTGGADDARPNVATNLVDRPSCSTTYQCLQPQLRSSEQGVAAAYENATLAGVPPRTLREYRAEWIRARGLAGKRPQEAIRVYGMIGSDLRLLAADPTVD